MLHTLQNGCLNGFNNWHKTAPYEHEYNLKPSNNVRGATQNHNINNVNNKLKNIAVCKLNQ
jgi:hypothetical protein